MNERKGKEEREGGEEMARKVEKRGCFKVE